MPDTISTGWFAGEQTITQPYGCTGFKLEPPRGNCQHFHSGIDIGLPMSTAITSPINGTVIENGNDPLGYGHFIRIAPDNTPGTVILLGHLQQSNVVKGSSVHPGQTIAYSGNTGNSNGPHLHFEVDTAASARGGQGGATDPIGWLTATKGGNPQTGQSTNPTDITAGVGEAISGAAGVFTLQWRRTLYFGAGGLLMAVGILILSVALLKGPAEAVARVAAPGYAAGRAIRGARRSRPASTAPAAPRPAPAPRRRAGAPRPRQTAKRAAEAGGINWGALTPEGRRRFREGYAGRRPV